MAHIKFESFGTRQFSVVAHCTTGTWYIDKHSNQDMSNRFTCLEDMEYYRLLKKLWRQNAAVFNQRCADHFTGRN